MGEVLYGHTWSLEVIAGHKGLKWSHQVTPCHRRSEQSQSSNMDTLGCRRSHLVTGGHRRSNMVTLGNMRSHLAIRLKMVTPGHSDRGLTWSHLVIGFHSWSQRYNMVTIGHRRSQNVTEF